MSQTISRHSRTSVHPQSPWTRMTCALFRLIWSVCIAGIVVLAGCEPENPSYPQKVIVLGIDGMDYGLTSKLMSDGRLPALAKIAERGGFKPLGTSIPPQSPVAWSNMITGANPGQHGVFDFIHRDPASGNLLSSTAQLAPPKPLPILGHSMDEITFFGYRWPLRSTHLVINRHAPAFWEYITERGIPAHVFRMPANYPPSSSSGAHYCCLSDMGTVDIRDTLGTFSYYSSDPEERAKRIDRAAGSFQFMEEKDDQLAGRFIGPMNPFVVQPKEAAGARARPPIAEVPFTIYRDPVEAVADIRFGDTDVILREGEWSDWYPIEFEMIPHAMSLKGICRFYLKEVHPHVKLYVSPINLDPQEESWEIDQPEDFSTVVSDSVGRYYTQGLPEDTEALINKVLSPDEFLQQTELVLQERLRLLDFAMDHYGGGLFFFYFGSTDQISHMFWGARSSDHPGITPEFHAKYKNLVEELYVRMDGIIAKVAKRFPDAVLMVISDHGFGEYRRRFNLNTWLRDNGYAKMRRPDIPKMAGNFDASGTRAYAVGFNSLYINLKGREARGVVSPAQKQALMDELTTKLKAFRDPDTGAKVIEEVYQTSKTFSGPMLPWGPDMVIGYALGYRSSGESAMGVFSNKLVEDNTRAWNADHMNAPYLVPGVLFCNRKIVVENPDLVDIAPSILARFGIAKPSPMEGRDLFEPNGAQSQRSSTTNIGAN